MPHAPASQVTLRFTHRGRNRGEGIVAILKKEGGFDDVGYFVGTSSLARAEITKILSKKSRRDGASHFMNHWAWIDSGAPHCTLNTISTSSLLHYRASFHSNEAIELFTGNFFYFFKWEHWTNEGTILAGLSPSLWPWKVRLQRKKTRSKLWLKTQLRFYN